MVFKHRRIIPQGTLKPCKGGTAHIPKLIRKELGNPREIPFVISNHTAILYNPEVSPGHIFESLKVLERTLRLRIVSQE